MLAKSHFGNRRGIRIFYKVLLATRTHARQGLSMASPVWMVLLVLANSRHQRMTLKLSRKVGNSLAVQWLGLHALTAEGLGSIPGQGTKIPQAV